MRVTAPWFVRKSEIEAFVAGKEGWIRDRLERLGAGGLRILPERFESGARVRFRGRLLRLEIEVAAVETPRLAFANRFHVRVPRGLSEAEGETAARELVVAWLHERAMEDAVGWSRRYGAQLGVMPTRITLRQQRTRWGSCSVSGAISLNWRLIAVPKAVYEYVAVHELCHLREHHHGPAFWELVESLLPDYRDRRRWFKENRLLLD